MRGPLQEHKPFVAVIPPPPPPSLSTALGPAVEAPSERGPPHSPPQTPPYFPSTLTDLAHGGCRYSAYARRRVMEGAAPQMAQSGRRGGRRMVRHVFRSPSNTSMRPLRGCPAPVMTLITSSACRHPTIPGTGPEQETGRSSKGKETAEPRVAHMFNDGWWRLAVGGWWRLAVGGWWRLAVGGWRLVAVGSWQWAVGGNWRLAVGGWW